MKKLSLVLAIALGTLVTCNMAMAQDASKKSKRGGMSADQRVDQMKKNLNLTDEQVPKVKAAMEDQQKKMQELRGETDQQARRTKMREIMEQTNTKMKGILTDEQYKKFQETMQQRGGNKGGERKSGERKGKKKAE